MTISLTRSESGVVVRFTLVPSPTHFLMVLRRDSLSVRYSRSSDRRIFLRQRRRVTSSVLLELAPFFPLPTPVQYLDLCLAVGWGCGSLTCSIVVL